MRKTIRINDTKVSLEDIRITQDCITFILHGRHYRLRVRPHAPCTYVVTYAEPPSASDDAAGDTPLPSSASSALGHPQRVVHAAMRTVQSSGSDAPLCRTPQIHMHCGIYEAQVHEAPSSAPAHTRRGDNMAASHATGGTHHAAMPAVVQQVHVQPGEEVAAGDALITLESMKLQTVVRAAHAGTTTTVHCAAGAMVDKGAPLVEITPHAVEGASSAADNEPPNTT